MRSFAAFDHNADQFFQYFSIDFGVNSQSAFHAANMLNQAMFVNDAILAIERLYADTSGSECVYIQPCLTKNDCEQFIDRVVRCDRPTTEV